MPAIQRTERRASSALQHSTHEVYRSLAALGDRLYLEALALCDDEQQAARWASALLVRSLEEQRLLRTLAASP